jgi:hypothetical protein
MFLYLFLGLHVAINSALAYEPITCRNFINKLLNESNLPQIGKNPGERARNLGTCDFSKGDEFPPTVNCSNKDGSHSISTTLNSKLLDEKDFENSNRSQDVIPKDWRGLDYYNEPFYKVVWTKSELPLSAFKTKIPLDKKSGKTEVVANTTTFWLKPVANGRFCELIDMKLEVRSQDIESQERFGTMTTINYLRSQECGEVLEAKQMQKSRTNSAKKFFGFISDKIGTKSAYYPLEERAGPSCAIAYSHFRSLNPIYKDQIGDDFVKSYAGSKFSGNLRSKGSFFSDTAQNDKRDSDSKNVK